jgi:HEAT repeat protein
MPKLPFLSPAPPDIGAMAARPDVAGLVKALGYPDPDIQWQAADALGALGPAATEALAAAIGSRNRDIRIGAIEALAARKNTGALPLLIDTLSDRGSEIRWAAALALGSAGDARAIPPLVGVLRDPDKYVRLGAAHALQSLGWVPGGPEEWGLYLLGMTNWPALERMGRTAIPALEHALTDRDASVRAEAVEVIGRIGDPRGIRALTLALRDECEEVRWAAVRAAPACGISPLHVPRWIQKRPRVRKNPVIAGILNFLLPGMGYFYLGMWWGIVIFQLDVSATLWLFASMGTDIAYDILFPLYVLLAVHAWYLSKRMPDA